MNRKKLSSIVVLLTVLSMVLAPMALADGATQGQFNVPNSAPVISGITPPGTADPYVETSIDVEVTDYNTMADIDRVKIVFYLASAGQAGSGDTQVRAIMEWVRGSGWSIDPNAGGTTWALNSGSCSTPASESATVETWTFTFTPGKVAAEGNWDTYAEAEDGDGQIGFNTHSSTAMNWRGEINVTSGNVTWTDVVPGSDYEDTNNKQSSISVNYIANGAYHEKLSASATWTGTPNADLDDTGVVANANEFALKAKDVDVYTSAVQVDSSGVTIDDTGGLTFEAGDTVSANTLWLKLAPGFATGTYTGTITYIIQDGS